MLFKLAFVSFAASALAHIPLDPVCPKGFYSGVQINDFQFDQPFQKFYERTKSFFDSSWYDDTLVNHTTGTDNKPGATREGPFGDGIFKELLVAYDSDGTSFLFQKYASLVQIDFAVQPDKELRVNSYTEQFTFDSICGGKATALRMMVVLCANDPVAVASFWNLIRENTTQTLADELGADTFVGNCPSLS